jgi:hypothetical protein
MLGAPFDSPFARLTASGMPQAWREESKGFPLMASHLQGEFPLVSSFNLGDDDDIVVMCGSSISCELFERFQNAFNMSHGIAGLVDWKAWMTPLPGEQPRARDFNIPFAHRDH